MRRPRIFLSGLLILAVVCLVLAVLAVVVVPGGLRRDRPIVLIQTPLQHQQVFLGEGLVVHATARGSSGIGRMELWVDGELLAADEPTEGPRSPAVLAMSWTPATLGEHTLVVRAVSRWGVAGQSTVAVVGVVAAGEAAPAPGEAAGETVAPGESGGAAAGGQESVPPAQPAPPGSAEGVVQSVELLRAVRVEEEAGDEVPLRIELLALQTGAAYEGLHCYIGLGGQPPRWVPDQDCDPSTDESFASLGGGEWDIAVHAAGAAALIVPWPGDHRLPVDLTCVGLGAGGLEAYDLGRLALSLGVETWDGVVRRAEAAGPEGSFAVEYRVAPHDGAPSWELTSLDMSMAFPTNLQLDWRSALLTWDYQPGEDEEPIDGFRIYLDDTVQWTESAEARQSRLPFEWMVPACGYQYRFTVDAYRGDDWSLPSNAVYVPEAAASEDCTRSLVATFETLTTGFLGGDGDHIGWVGPVYGELYVNDQVMSFDGRCGSGEVCGLVGLGHDTVYDLEEYMGEISRGSTTIYLHLDENERIELGYAFWDEDRGDDPVLCRASDDVSQAVDRPVEGTLESDNGRCSISYSIRPVFGSPVEGIAGEPPRPNLIVEDLDLDVETGELLIDIRNMGAATAAEQDLDVALEWPSGEAIGAYTFPIYLAPGARTTLRQADMTPAPALGACVILDPNNTILEEGEESPAGGHEPFCLPLPNLVISQVNYDSDRQSLLITVANWDLGDFGPQPLEIDLQFADGLNPQEAIWTGVSLGPMVETVLEWPGLGPAHRERLMAGYTLTLDPHGRLAESDPTDNRFVWSVPEVSSYRLMWGRVYVPYYQVQGHDEWNADAFWAEVRVVERLTGRVLAIPGDWHTDTTEESCRVEHDADSWGPGRRQGNCHNEGDRAEFGLGPDLAVEISVSGHMGFWSPLGGGGLAEYDLGQARLVLEPDTWAAAPLCSTYGSLEFEIHGFPTADLDGPDWFTVFTLCRL